MRQYGSDRLLIDFDISPERRQRTWDATTGTEIKVLREYDDWVGSAAFSPDGTRIVTASRDGTARIWDAMAGTE